MMWPLIPMLTVPALDSGPTMASRTLDNADCPAYNTPRLWEFKAKTQFSAALAQGANRPRSASGP
jgi:hypothetical protein